MDQSEVANDLTLQQFSGEYADLLSIQQDLAFVGEAARRYASIHDDSDAVLLRALWGAALIAYRRCFTTGRGHGLVKRSRLVLPQTDIDALDGSLQEFHRLVLQSADQHVAHRVDDDKSPMPIYLLFGDDPTGKPQIVGITSLGALFIGPLPEGAEQLDRLADHFGTSVTRLIEIQRAAIFARASALLDD